MDRQHDGHEHWRARRSRDNRDGQRFTGGRLDGRSNDRRWKGQPRGREGRSWREEGQGGEWPEPHEPHPAEVLLVAAQPAASPANGLLGRLKMTASSVGGTLGGLLKRGAAGVNTLQAIPTELDEGLHGTSPGPLTPVSGIGALISTLDWDSVRAEVDREASARIAVAGALDAGKSTLVNCLKGADVSPAALAGDGRLPGAIVEDLGLFVIADVTPGSPDGARTDQDEAAWDAIQASDMVLWVLDGGTGMRAWEHEWICRVRASGKPLLIVLNKLDLVQDAGAIERMKRTLACPVVCVGARDGTNVTGELLPRIADASPALNTALGRESPAWRRVAAQRVTRRAALLSGLVGVEPLPLLDIPFQVLIMLRLVLRIAAIYDEPRGDRFSRELLATMVGGVALRYAGQQIAKLVPLLGWLVSGALAAGGAWVIGAAAEKYFANGRRVLLPQVKLPRIKIVQE